MLLEEKLDQAVYASEEEQNIIIHELADSLDETLDALIQILERHNYHKKWILAIKIIKLIGYPRNASALQQLIDHASDGNDEAQLEARQALLELEPTVVAAALVQAILSPAQRDELWAYRIENISMFLWNLDPAYSRPCIPALVYILASHNYPHHPDTLTLLEALEKLGVEHSPYALPVLIDIIQREGASESGQKAQTLITSFSGSSLEPYHLILPFTHT